MVQYCSLRARNLPGFQPVHCPIWRWNYSSCVDLKSKGLERALFCAALFHIFQSQLCPYPWVHLMTEFPSSSPPQPQRSFQIRLRGPEREKSVLRERSFIFFFSETPPPPRSQRFFLYYFFWVFFKQQSQRDMRPTRCWLCNALSCGYNGLGMPNIRPSYLGPSAGALDFAMFMTHDGGGNGERKKKWERWHSIYCQGI